MLIIRFFQDITKCGNRVRFIPLPIREDPASNLGQETNHLDWVPPDNSVLVTHTGQRTHPYISFLAHPAIRHKLLPELVNKLGNWASGWVVRRAVYSEGMGSNYQPTRFSVTLADFRRKAGQYIPEDINLPDHCNVRTSNPITTKTV
jgi:hypothetical protein